VLEETHDNDQIIQRVAALDVGKAELTCCVRVPGLGKSGKRLQEVRSYQTMTRWLLVLADRLGELGVTRVVMEATSDYWRGVFYLLEAHGFQTWLVNARDARAPPGTAQDRHPGCGLAVQARRAAAAAAQLGPPTADPAAARRDPLPGGSGGGPDRGEAAGRAAAGWTPRSS
jgi:transposase